MSFKVISARHVTPRQRAIIAWLAENKAMSAATKQIRANVEAMPDGLHKVTFRKVERDDWNRPVERVSTAIIQFT